MLCKFKNATCLPACLAGSFTHQEHKWFKTQMLSNLRCRSTLQWSNYCLGGSYYPHHDMNSTQSKHAFIGIYFPNYSIVKRSFERSFWSLNVNLTIFFPCLERQRIPAVFLSYYIGFPPTPPCKHKQPKLRHGCYMLLTRDYKHKVACKGKHIMLLHPDQHCLLLIATTKCCSTFGQMRISHRTVQES